MTIDPVTQSWIRDRSDQIAAERGYYFHAPSGEHVINFSVSVCKVTPLDWERDCIMRLYGWRRPDGRRRFSRGYISVAKKNGKTLLSSILAMYTMLVERGDVASAANSRQQASEVFSDLQKFVNASSALKKRCEVIPSTKRVLVPSTLTNYRAMSADAVTGDGVRAKLALYDELHRARDSDLYTVLQAAGDGQTEPLFLVVSTSGATLTSPCGEVYSMAKRIEAGNITDPAELSFFTCIHEAPEDADIGLEATWRQANPALGQTIDLDRFRGLYLEAINSPTKLALFRRLRLNQWVDIDTEDAWLDQEAWAACGDSSVMLDTLRGRECIGGLDLSSTRDTTALLLLFKLDDGRLYILPHFWLPSHDLAKREKRDGVPYRAWAEAPGSTLHLTPGNVQDYAVIRKTINELRTLYQIKEIAIDRWNAMNLITELTSDGFTMTPFGQGFGSLSGPSKEFERLVLSKGLAHPNNPLLSHMAGKVIVEVDAAANIKPSKKKSTHRIDGIVAAVMALGRHMHMAAQPEYTGELTA